MQNNHFWDTVLPLLAHQYPWMIPVIAVLLPLSAVVKASAGLIQAWAYNKSLSEKRLTDDLARTQLELDAAKKQVEELTALQSVLEAKKRAVDKPS